MEAARRLEDAPRRITREEEELLNECSSRFRVHLLRQPPAAETTMTGDAPESASTHRRRAVG